MVAVVTVAPRLSGEFDADFATPGSESQAAAQLLAERFPGSSSETIDVVWRAPGGVRSDPVERRSDRFLERATRLEGIDEVGRVRVAPGGEIAMASLQLDRRAWDVPVETGETLIERAEAVSGEGLRIELGGGPIQAAQEAFTPEAAALVGAAVILLVAFGSVVAAGLPIATALFGLAISSSLIGVVAAVMDVPEFAPSVAALIGIGVGIDYALLILTRFRSALADGAETAAAITEAVSTAGRSVLVAGATVVVSLLGLFLMGVSYLGGVAVSAGLAVLIVMGAAVTLVPVLLSFAGNRVNRLRIPGLARDPRPGKGAPAARWSRLIQRHPWPAALAGAAILLALTSPVLGLRFGFPDAGNSPQGTTTRAAYELTTEGFGPGANGPLLLAADLRDSGVGRAQLSRLAERLRGIGGVASVSDPRMNPDGNAALLTVVPASRPQDPATKDLVGRLRDQVLPPLEDRNGLDIHVGGVTAALVDQSGLVASRLPLFIGGVVAVSLVLLLAAFRSPLIAFKAGVMNLLSVGAAYGVVALVAEGGFLGELVGIDTDTPVPPFIPVMMFAILFGLSMDYEVFLLSRVREEFLGHGRPSRAVSDGLAKTARVISAAAAIMVVVFLAFVFSPEVFLKMMGVGMAAAIFVDATVVRMVLVPSVMQLLGRANWWIPSWLERILPGSTPTPHAA